MVIIPDVKIMYIRLFQIESGAFALQQTLLQMSGII